jgi:SAM-dependent methyltransferase
MSKNDSAYDADGIARYFDEYGQREWDRLVATPVDEVSLYIHSQILHQNVRTGWRVLEIGAGAGRFTQVLAGLGARVLVADISIGQLELNQQQARYHGFVDAIEDWQQVDICDMEGITDEAFDCVVAYGGPFSYVLDRRDQALRECKRVLKPGGLLLLSVMSLWGTAHRHLGGVLDLPPAANRLIVASGDISPQTFPGRAGNFMHLFRAGELRHWLASELEVLAMSSCGCLSSGWEDELATIRQNPELWDELMRMELAASAERESLNMGTHIIAVTRKPE